MPKKKSVFEGNHDKQIFDDKHDEIVVWLYEKLKDKAYTKTLLCVSDNIEIINLNVKIEMPIIKTHGVPIGFADLAVFCLILRPFNKQERKNSILYIKDDITKEENKLSSYKYQIKNY